MSEEEQVRARIRSFLYKERVCGLFGSATALHTSLCLMHAAGNMGAGQERGHVRRRADKRGPSLAPIHKHALACMPAIQAQALVQS